MLTDIIVIIVVLALSAFFSAMEIAFVASSRLRIELERSGRPVFAFISRIFLSNPGQYLSTILIGNNIALVIFSMVMGGILSLYVTSNIALETLISSTIVIIFAEFLPKALAKKEPHLYLRIFAVPLLIFYVLFYPIATFCTWISVFLVWIFTGRFLKSHDSAWHFDLADLQDLVEDGVQQGKGDDEVDTEDLAMFQKALDFSELKVRDCMVPRVEVEAADIADGFDTLKKLFITSHYSRIPIFEGSVDNIIGYASSKSLFDPDITDIRQMLLEAVYVPMSFSAKKLMETFIRKRKNMAVVIDEFGATAGIVTLEDIIEQIVGEIEDEHDVEDMVERQLEDGKWIFSGRQEIEYINENYGLEIPLNDEYDTIAGWILFNCEELPETGTEYILDGLKVRIKRASDSRISLVELSRNEKI